MLSFNDFQKKTYIYISALLTTTLFTINFWAVETTENEEHLPKRLVALINQRFDYMRDTAHYKSKHGLTVEDSAREQSTIDAMKQHAEESGISIDETERFYEQLIYLCKKRQKYLLDAINLTATAKPTLDLYSEIRPKLDIINQAIIEEIKIYLSENDTFNNQTEPYFIEHLMSTGLNKQDLQTLYARLQSIKMLKRDTIIENAENY